MDTTTIKQEFINNSAIATNVFDLAVKILPDIEYDYLAKEVEGTPLFDILGWKYTRFTHEARPNLLGATFFQETGEPWQSKIFGFSDNGKRSGKYYAPKGIGDVPYIPPVPQEIRENIALKYDLTPPEPDQPFWPWFTLNKIIPLVIDEGGKKVLCTLSGGNASVGIFGCTCGAKWNPLSKRYELIPQLKPLVYKRQVLITLDQGDIKKSSIKSVKQGIKRLAQAIKNAGGEPLVVVWDKELGKSIDDVAANHGLEKVQEILDNAISYDEWLGSQVETDFLTFLPSVQINERYFNVEIPTDKKLVVIQGAQNTGKTEMLVRRCRKAIKKGRPIFILSHLENLARVLGKRLGVPYRTERRTDGTILGYALVTDSLRPKHKGFNADHWDSDRWRDVIDPLVILDECEQVIWHTLNGQTDIKHYRVQVLKQLQKLLNISFQIILADADLSDEGINFINELLDKPVEPHIIVNDYQHEGWDYYTFSSSLEWHSNLIKKAKQGKKLLILTAAQKPESKNGTMAIENRLNNEFNKLSKEWEIKEQHCVNLYQLAVTIFSCLSPELNVNLNLVKPFIQQLTSLFNSQLTQELSQELNQKLSEENNSQFNDESTSNFTEADILRVDSETLTEKGHPACLGKSDLNALFKKYRIVVASPSIVSGISLDLEDHFDEVWALSTGAISPTNFVQFLWRLRANVPRFIYVNKLSNIGLIGNGSTNPNHLMRSEKKKIKLTLASLREFDSLSMEDVDSWVDPICIKTWAKMGARINRQMKTYRNTVYALLDAQNHRRHDWSDSLDKEGRKEERETLTENRNQVRDEYLSDRVNAKDITHNTAKQIEEKVIKSKEEKAQLGKYNLNQKYGQVTQEIALADHLGLHPKLRLHYHLTMGRKFVEEKDTANLKTLLENNDGAAFIPDVNRILKIGKVRVLELLGVLSLVSKEREFVATDEDLIGRTKLAIHNTSEIQSIFGISICQPTVNPKTDEIILPTIKVIRQELNIIGYDLERTKRQMIDGKLQYIYKLVDLLPSLTRQEIFNYWLTKDREYSMNFSETKDMEEEFNQDRDKSMVEEENIEVVREKNEVARETVYSNSTSRTNEAVPSLKVGMEVINLTTSRIGKIISVSKKLSEVLVQCADHVISYNLSTFWEQMELTF